MIPANVGPQLNSKSIPAPSESGSLASAPTFGVGQSQEFKLQLDQAVKGGGDLSEGGLGIPKLPIEEDQAVKTALEISREESTKEVNEAFLQPPARFIEQGSQKCVTDIKPEAVGLEMGPVSGLKGVIVQDSHKSGPGAVVHSKAIITPLDAKSAEQVEIDTHQLETSDFLSEKENLGGVERNHRIVDGLGVSVEKLLSNPSVKLERLETGMGPDLKTLQGESNVSLPSRVSTEDFLSLRDLRRDMSNKEAGLKSPGPALDQPFKAPLHLGPVIEAPVIHGAGAKTILSHDAIQQISHQVNLLGNARQDGEIKIRLKPDHLGELIMNVKSRGNEVSIQIKTHDLEAKKIIEESIGRLKESLTVQNLNLSSMDVVTQTVPTQSADQSTQMDFNQNQNAFGRGDSQGWNETGRGTGQEFLYDEGPAPVKLQSRAPSRSGRGLGAGTLDLIA
ncbi:MAG: flagellar hook-length control protein FliK [Bdellovibrionales bacterium]|nr:flagellar hook-length control protein FliK [Bdellovibrionales bacterium]